LDELVYSRRLMRFLLAFLAVLALTANPVTAAAARVTCHHGGAMAMAGMDMPVAHQARTGADPCCNHGDQKNGQNGKGCAQACATSCALAAALPASSASIAPGYARTPLPAAQLATAHAHEPAGPERPPKSMA
jgi:hypothetical protein